MNQVFTQKTGRAFALSCLMMGLSMTRLVAQPNSGNATMTVNLSDVLQLTVNTPALSLNFATATNYINGVTSVVNNQLSITSNKTYSLSIRAAGANLVNGANTIPVSNVAVQPVGLVGGTSRVVSALSTTDQALATGLPATMATAVNLQYSTAANNTAFLKPAGAYVTTITFTAVAN